MNYSLNDMIERLLSEDKFFPYYLNYFDFLAKDETRFAALLFSETVEPLLYAPNDEIRMILPKCIKFNMAKVADFLKQ